MNPSINNAMRTAAGISGLCMVIIIALVIIQLLTIIDILKNDFDKPEQKTTWLIFVFFSGPTLIASILYFFIGIPQKNLR